jgi:hypothetical protein
MIEEGETSTPDDLAALRRRVAELEQQLDEWAQREAALQDEMRRLSTRRRRCCTSCRRR